MSDDYDEKKKRFMKNLCMIIAGEFDTHAKAFCMSLPEEQQKDLNNIAGVFCLLIELLATLNSGLLKTFMRDLDETEKNKQESINLAIDTLIEFLNYERENAS